MNSEQPVSIQIDNKHAGGNIEVISVQDDHVLLQQELRDTTNWWFYWNFSAVSSAKKKVLFEFVNGEVVGPWGPAVSEDGLNWRWLGTASLVSRQAFTYTFQDAGEKVYFCFCLPYQLYHFEQFYTHIADHKKVTREIFTHSELLRPIPLLLLGNREADRHIIFTARHHSCESTPSYMLEGLLGCLLETDSSPILQRYLLHYIPFMDIDGVENGDQGKARFPHDHNRDYIEAPLYRSTAALMDYTRGLRTSVAIDFHGPYKWGERNDVTFFVKRGSAERIEALSNLLERMSGERNDKDAIRHLSAHDLGMGEEWNLPHGKGCGDFFSRSGTPLACGFEFPYFGKEDAPFLVNNSRRFGQDFARALEAYLLEYET